MTTKVRRLLLLAGLTTAVACGGHKSGPEDPAPKYEPASLFVQNQNPNTFAIYIENQSTGIRKRLGDAPGNMTHAFTIPDDLVKNGSNVRFIALQIANRGAPPQTQDIVVRPGEQVTIRILP